MSTADLTVAVAGTGRDRARLERLLDSYGAPAGRGTVMFWT